MHPAAWVYILTNHPRHTTLYVGYSTILPVRLGQHRTKKNPGSFTAKYNVSSLVYYEEFDCVEDAIRREKFIKGKTRKWKEELINKFNPDWRDLTGEIKS